MTCHVCHKVSLNTVVVTMKEDQCSVQQPLYCIVTKWLLNPTHAERWDSREWVPAENQAKRAESVPLLPSPEDTPLPFTPLQRLLHYPQL